MEEMGHELELKDVKGYEEHVPQRAANTCMTAHAGHCPKDFTPVSHSILTAALQASSAIAQALTAVSSAVLGNGAHSDVRIITASFRGSAEEQQQECHGVRLDG